MGLPDFISYCLANEDLPDQLDQQLRLRQREGMIEP